MLKDVKLYYRIPNIFNYKLTHPQGLNRKTDVSNVFIFHISQENEILKNRRLNISLCILSLGMTKFVVQSAKNSVT